MAIFNKERSDTIANAALINVSAIFYKKCLYLGNVFKLRTIGWIWVKLLVIKQGRIC